MALTTVGAGLIVGAGLSRRLSKKMDMSWDRLEGVAWGGLPWLSQTVREGAGRALTRPLAGALRLLSKVLI